MTFPLHTVKPNSVNLRPTQSRLLQKSFFKRMLLLLCSISILAGFGVNAQDSASSEENGKLREGVIKAMDVLEKKGFLRNCDQVCRAKMITKILEGIDIKGYYIGPDEDQETVLASAYAFRKHIEPTFYFKTIKEWMGYFRLTRFRAEFTKKFLNAVKEKEDVKNVEGYVIDLRSASGESLKHTEGLIEALKDFSPAKAILIDENTSGAAEIFVRKLLKDKDRRTVVVGNKSMGAPCPFKAYPLPDGGELLLPSREKVAKETPNWPPHPIKPGISVAEQVSPQQLGQWDEEQKIEQHVEGDAALEKAIDLLKAVRVFSD